MAEGNVNNAPGGSPLYSARARESGAFARGVDLA
jgi:hypothetical protein